MKMWLTTRWSPKRSANYPFILAVYSFLFFLSIAACKFFTRDEFYLDDDAYYYVVIAENILRDHLSTFDGQTLTNGYQPLWLGFLLTQYAFLGSSVYVTVILQILLISAGLYLLLSALDCRQFIPCAIFAIVYARSMTLILGDGGMEIPLWTVCFAGMIWMAKKIDLSRPGGALSLGFMASLCIAVRIDSAVFVLPLALLVLPTIRMRLQAFFLVGLLALGYVGWNNSVFGMPFPISGAIKSLGGFQLNHTLIDQLGKFDTANVFWPLKMLLSAPWQMAILWVAAPFGIYFSPRGSLARRILVAYMVGLLAYSLKLLFFSSWRIWEWYNYPLVIGMTAILYAGLPHLSRYMSGISSEFRRFAVTGLAALLFFAPTALCLSFTMNSKADDFTAISKLAVNQLATRLDNQPVAMGDRAGSFAYFYGGSVTQLEGLVNDKEYYELVSSGVDIKPLLCRRGVKFFVSFSIDLGTDYFNREIKIYRPSLTQFKGPIIRVSRSQEVGKVFDLSKFDNRSSDEGDNYLYVWNLACSGSRGGLQG